MNKSKGSISQTKVKPKLSNLSPSNNKSPTKSKQKFDKTSPRSNRIQTLEPKKIIQIPKKTNLLIRTDQPLRQVLKNINEHASGYETPKFKCQTILTDKHKKNITTHNFFSFGEKEFENTASKKKIDKPKQREKEINLRMRAQKQLIKPYRKDQHPR